MATPILKIPVDDAAFQRYLRAFQKYQDQLDSQPEMWKGINDATKGAALAGMALASEIKHQADETKKLADEEEKREAKLKAAAKEREREAREQEKREQAAANRRQKAIQQVKDYARNLADAALSMGKWTVMGGAMGMVSSALGLWGLDRLAEGPAGLLRQSAGMGVSMGQNQGANLAMQRYFDVNSVMGNVANMQANPAQWGAFRMMGINPQGANPADLTYQAAVAARRMFIADKGNLALAQAQGLTQIFSPEDLRRMASAKPEEFHRLIKEGKGFNNISDAVGHKWQNFLFTMDKAKLKVEDVLVTGLSKLADPLGRVVEKFGDLIAKGLDKLGPSLDVFAKYLGSEDFQKDFKYFIDCIEAIATKIANGLRILGIIPDKPGSTGGAGDGQTVLDFGPLGKIIRTDGEKSRTTPANAAESNWLGKHLMMYGGFSQAGAKGVLTNIIAESGGDPFAWGDKGAAYGIGQWHADRRQKFYEHSKELFGYQHTMESVKDRKRALDEQIRFMEWEFNNTEKVAGNLIKNSPNKAVAAYRTAYYYERPANRDREGNRRANASANVNIKIENKTGHSVSTTANSAAGGK